MGLDCSHDAFHGAYSAFNRFRQIVAKAAGGSYPPHDDESLLKDKWYFAEGKNKTTNPGLHAFLSHPDCDGEISPEVCVVVADELEALLPEIDKLSGDEQGHIARDGGYVAVTKRFIAGCRSAAEKSEPLAFY